MIALGLRLEWLGTVRLSWRDLLVVVNQSHRETALFRAMYPDEAHWGLPEQLLAAVFDALQAANWQRQGVSHAPRPKPIPRPGVEPTEKHIGSAGVPMDEMARLLGWEVTT